MKKIVLSVFAMLTLGSSAAYAGGSQIRFFGFGPHCSVWEAARGLCNVKNNHRGGWQRDHGRGHHHGPHRPHRR